MSVVLHEAASRRDQRQGIAWNPLANSDMYKKETVSTPVACSPGNTLGPSPGRNHATSRETRPHQGEDGQPDRVRQLRPGPDHLEQFGVGNGQCIAFCSALFEKCGIPWGFVGSSNPSLSAIRVCSMSR